MRTTLFFLFVLSVSILNAQSVEREVISSNGEFYSNSSGQLSTTLGEPVISTYTNGSNDLTQGFQQTNIVVTQIKNEQSDFSIMIYPNPSEDYLVIGMDEFREGIIFSLFTIDGKMILEKTINEKITILNTKELSKGTYMLTIIDSDKKIKTFKILKQ